MAIVTIIGSGMMGSALTYPLIDNKNTVRLVGTPLDDAIIKRASVDSYHITMKRTLPAGIEYYYSDSISKALDGADILICGVSSFGVDWFADNVLKTLPSSIPVLSVTKGLYAEEGKLYTFPEYYRRRLGRNDLSLNCIGGPCTSYELADLHQTCVAFCGDDVTTLEKMKSILQTPYYHVTVTTDVRGIECAVALKNGYALGVTLAVGMAEREYGEGCVPHYNTQAALFTEATREMTKLIIEEGGTKFAVPFGIGDLYVTIYGGRTRMIGTLLGRGIPYSECLERLNGVTLESLAVTTQVIKAFTERGDDFSQFPLLKHISRLMNGEKVDIPWNEFNTQVF